jgi:hypothetical protein
MNLGKLLAAGKSIIGGRREISYRISNRVYLPKFISPKNPFAPAVKAEPPTQEKPKPVNKGITSDEAKTQMRPAFPAARPRKRVWIGKLNPISLWRSVRPPVPQKTQRPRQAELSLDRVKVVHNDLSDVDVEVVPIKSRTISGPESPVLPPAHGGDSWSRLSAKIFGAKAA